MNLKEAKELYLDASYIGDGTIFLVSEAKGFLEGYSQGKADGEASVREKMKPVVEILKEIIDQGSCWNPKDLGGCGGNYHGEPCPHHKAKIILKTIQEVSGANEESIREIEG